MPDKLIKN